MYDDIAFDYGYGEDDGSDEWLEVNDDRAAQNHQMDLERQVQDWQTILDNDSGYQEWANKMDSADLEAQILEQAAMEDERNFRTLQPWD